MMTENGHLWTANAMYQNKPHVIMSVVWLLSDMYYVFSFLARTPQQHEHTKENSQPY